MDAQNHSANISESVNSGGYHREILYSTIILIIGAAVRHANEVLRIPIPYTVIVFFAGMILGLLPAGNIVHMGPHTIITVFIPILIFEGSFFIDIYIFKEIFVQVLILAIPALVVMIALTATTTVYLFHIENWNWIVAFLIGSILSATDPVAVVAIMKDLDYLDKTTRAFITAAHMLPALYDKTNTNYSNRIYINKAWDNIGKQVELDGANKKLSLLIEGESMLNDGTAMICFELFLDLVEKPKGMSRDDILWKILDIIWISFGGPFFGFCMAMIAVFWLQHTFNDSLTEICVTLTMSYLTFYIASDMLVVSGVLAVVTFGVVVGDQKTCISPEVEASLHSFWEMLAFIANTYIFALCGLIISKRVLSISHLTDFIVLIILYVMVQCIRFITIFMFKPILKRIGGGLTWQDGVICAWSGLRGAVGLALALIVFKTLSGGPEATLGGYILFHVSLIVVATLLINATTIAALLHFLGMSDVSAVRKQSMAKAVQILESSMQRAKDVWKVDRFLTNADWKTVSKLCAIEDPYRISETQQEKEQRERQQMSCPECQTVIPYVPTQSEIEKQREEAVSKFVKLLKRSYWRQFEKGLLYGTSLRKLIEMAEGGSHVDMEFLNIKHFRQAWKAKPWMVTWVKCLGWNSVTFSWKVIEEHNRHGQAIRALYRFCQHWMLSLIIFGTDSALSLTILILCLMKWNTKDSDKGTNIASIAAMSISSAYFIMRVIVFGKQFIRTSWFIFGLLFIILVPVDLVSNTILLEEDMTHNCQLKSVFRSLRVLQLMELVFLFVYHKLNLFLYNKVRRTCDMARGFVRAHENAQRMIDNISDQENIRMTIKQESEAAKVAMLRELGLLQGIHPSIAVEVKTCHAIRAVLNVMREGMKKLMQEGGVDETEGRCFIEVIESEMKHLKVAPPKVSSPSIHKILINTPWIGRNEKLIQFIQSHVTHLVFEFGTTIMQAGEEANGVYFIISGLIKLEGTSSISSSAHNPYLSSGNVIGEITTLTGFPRSVTLTSETVVRVMFLPKKAFMEAINTFHHQDGRPLSKYLWRLTALRLAFSVLYTLPTYKLYKKEILLARLENSTLHYMKEPNLKFQVEPVMKNLVLIIGAAQGSNGKQYEGLCYIPPGVNWLKFNKGQSPVPLLLYNETHMLRRSSRSEMFVRQHISTPLSSMRLPDF